MQGETIKFKPGHDNSFFLCVFVTEQLSWEVENLASRIFDPALPRAPHWRSFCICTVEKKLYGVVVDQ